MFGSSPGINLKNVGFWSGSGSGSGLGIHLKIISGSGPVTETSGPVTYLGAHAGLFCQLLQVDHTSMISDTQISTAVQIYTNIFGASN